MVAGIEDIRAEGKHTVVFDLKTGNADFPFLLADWHLVIAPAGTKGAQWDEGNRHGALHPHRMEAG